MTQVALAELLSADLSELDLVCLMSDGVHFGEHTCVVALGIALDGTKHPLALQEGSTENTTLARDLLTGLRERGLDTTRPILCVIDGAKALRRAILDVLDHPVIARCQQHKIRNVRDRLPQRLGGPVERRMRTAYHAASALDAQAQARGAGPRARQDPPRRRHLSARGHERDPDHPAAGGAADAGPHAALHG